MKLNKAKVKDIAWHSGKALLCGLQLLALCFISSRSIGQFMDFLRNDLIIRKGSAAEALLFFLFPITAVILFAAFWRYYDHIDDRSFNRFREAYRNEEQVPNLLQEPAYRAGLIATVLCATPVITLSLLLALRATGMGTFLCFIVSIPVSLSLVVGLSILRIRRRAALWFAQRNLPVDTDKARIVPRILYAVVLFGAVAALIIFGFTILIPLIGSLVLGIIRLLWKAILIISGILVVWFFLYHALRRMADRRKFLKRLAQMRDRGELSFQIHGHPYLSAFWGRVPFGLTITDAPHPDGKRKSDITYQVAVANCRFRRGMVVLCDNNVYRFVHSINFRTIAQQNWGGLSVASSRIVSMPVASFYTNHSFDFPEGEGKRILLVDPAPRVLCMHGFREGELITLDNASEVFGYTVYGKKSFLNLLERT